MTISLIRRLPDPATAHVEFPEYQRLRDEYLARMAERTVNDQAVQAHQRVERAAMEADRNAYAAAIRAGKPDPGQKFAEEWKATDARLRRKLAAEEQALAMIEGDIARALEQHAGKYAATVDVRIIEAQQDLRLAVEAYIEAREDLMAAEELRTFLGNPTRPALPRSPRRNKVSDRFLQLNGEPFGWDQVVAAIREDAAAPEEKEVTLHVREDISGLKVGTVPGR